jgi:nitrite reductase/ring-hydroxylating ferredoxin subunit
MPSSKVKIAKSIDFKNKNYKCVKYKNRPLAIFKQKDGSFYALEAYCKHQNALLPMNSARANIVTCPRHNWRYNVKTGACLNEPWAALKRFSVEDKEGYLYLIEVEEDKELDEFS